MVKDCLAFCSEINLALPNYVLLQYISDCSTTEVINITFTLPPFIQIFQKVFDVNLTLDTRAHWCHHHRKNSDTSNQLLISLCLKDLSELRLELICRVIGMSRLPLMPVSDLL